jgi:hypothetical protein
MYQHASLLAEAGRDVAVAPVDGEAPRGVRGYFGRSMLLALSDSFPASDVR